VHAAAVGRLERVDGRQGDRIGVADDVGGAVDGDPVGDVVLRAAEVGRERERAAGLVATSDGSAPFVPEAGVLAVLTGPSDQDGLPTGLGVARKVKAIG
jgi:hypothetical protein